MTADQITLALSLARIQFKPFAKKKQFSRRMEWQALNEPENPITDGEFQYLCLLAVRYHKQLSAEAVKLANDHLAVLSARKEVA